MYDLQLISQAMGEIGRSYVSLDFEDHPIWSTLSNLSPETSSTAIIDNTLVRHALTLMRDGLGDENSLHAALLPDLSLLFFGLTHFEKLILLDHGLSKEELEEVDEIFPNVIHVFSWRTALDNDNELKNDLYRKFNSIQEEFRERTETHEEWKQAWRHLLGNENIRTVYFHRDKIDELLDSPAHPLHRDVEKLDENWPNILNQDLPERERYRRPSTFQDLPFSDKLSLLASYHTFRSIFYYCLSEHLDYPYLANGMRGVATNFLPVEFLTRDMDHLNPNLHLNLEKLAMLPAYKREPPIVQLPVLRVTPSLVNVTRIVRQFSVPNWTAIVQELRADSFEYRKNVRIFLEACSEEAFDYGKVVALAQILAGGNVLSAWDASACVLRVAGTLAGSYVTHNPKAAVEGLREAVKTKPWEFVTNWVQRRKLSFILRARDLAASALSLEQECEKTWKRGFSTKEREYLERLQRASPLYGL